MGMHPLLDSRWRRLAASCALAVATSAAASGSQAVNIAAVVLGNSNCRFTSASPSALDFGTIDPSSAANATASVTIGYRCNGGSAIVTWNIVANDGLHPAGPGAQRMRHATNLTQYLPYSLNLPTSGTVPRNTNQTMTLTGTVTPAAFQTAIAGSYADIVVLTIAP